MRPRHTKAVATVLLLSLATFGAVSFAADGKDADKQPKAKALFPDKGKPKGWHAGLWSDVSQQAPQGTEWTVDDEGVLHCTNERGSWLVSDAEYSDFILTFEFKLGERGNSGCGIRFPPAGDPAFDGIEIQMADERYNNGTDGPDKLTGAIYKAVAPQKQVYKPTQWNKYVISVKGPSLKVELNGELIQDVNLDQHTAKIERHDGTPAPALKDRPRKGHIGFQELSRGGGHVMIKNAMITVLDEAK